jgi:hypothetical protein
VGPGHSAVFEFPVRSKMSNSFKFEFQTHSN